MTHGKRGLMHEKRQSVRRSTTAAGRPTSARTTRVRTTPTATDPEDETTTRRNNTPLTTSTTPVRTTPLPSVTPTPTTPSTTNIAPRPSTTSNTIDGAAGDSNNNNNKAADSSGSSNHTGLIVGVVIAVLAALAISTLLFFFIRKRRARRQDTFGAFNKEKADDEQSFIGAGGLANTSQVGEKYGMSSIGHGQGGNWANNSDVSYVHTPAGSQMASQDVHPYGMAAPSFAPPPDGAARFAPPQAAMMSHPADRLSVGNPYTAAQINAQGGAGMPAIAEDSPFEDPQWANKLFRVARTFQPSMPDELIIMPGDRIRILMAYDDGWCLGENLDSVPPNSPHQPVRGVFPRDCVEEIGLAQQPISSAPSMPTLAENAGPFAPEPSPISMPANVGPSLAPRVGSPTKGSPTKGASLQRAPTLPPLDVGGRASQTFAGTSHLSQAEETTALPAVIESKPSHLSTSSSLNQESSLIIDEFPIPNKPAAGPSASATGSGTQTPVKRSSSLIAGKDKELFAALELGEHEGAHDEEAEKDQLK